MILNKQNRNWKAEKLRWETDYLIIDFKGKPVCLVCLETLSVMNDFNISRHYNTLHKFKYEKYTTAARAAIVADLKSKVQKQQYFFFFTSATTTQESALNASYGVALELAKAKKPLLLGTYNLVKNFEGVSLSRHTVTRRVFDIHDHIEEKMKQVMYDCKYFSLTLDESTDVTDVSQLLIFTRTIDISFEVHEELLKLVSLHDTTCHDSVPLAYGCFDKLSAVVTDGAPAMQGRHTGFEGLLQQNSANCPILHCIIHQALCARTLDFSHVMDLVTKITNLIRGGNRSLSHRRLTAFLDDVDAAYGDLQMHTDIRWMSRGKCLERFFALRSEIPVFLEDSVRGDTSAYCRKLKRHCIPLRHGLPYGHYLTSKSLKHKFAGETSWTPSLLLSASNPQNCSLNSAICSQTHFFFFFKQEILLSMIRMFGSAYICESSFSTMKHIKSKERNGLTDDTVFHLMRIGCTEFDTDIQSVVHQQAKPQVSHFTERVRSY
uniref:SPIN-DOC-like zinc-finger domain-containing protein n=1 Tax=Monopterus albus TaxID=43700 RepID=A0A3Q3ISJ2_MONAL